MGSVSAYPDYKERPLISLLTELIVLEKEGTRQDAVELRDWCVSITPHELKEKTLKQLYEQFDKKYIAKYWERSDLSDFLCVRSVVRFRSSMR